MFVCLSSSALFCAINALLFCLLVPLIDAQTTATLVVDSREHGFCQQGISKFPLRYPSSGDSLPQGTLLEISGLNGQWTTQQVSIPGGNPPAKKYVNWFGYANSLTGCDGFTQTDGALVLSVKCDNGMMQYAEVTEFPYSLLCTGKVSFGIWDNTIQGNDGTIQFQLTATLPKWEVDGCQGAWEPSCAGQCGRTIAQTRPVYCKTKSDRNSYQLHSLFVDGCLAVAPKPPTSRSFLCQC